MIVQLDGRAEHRWAAHRDAPADFWTKRLAKSSAAGGRIWERTWLSVLTGSGRSSHRSRNEWAEWP